MRAVLSVIVALVMAPIADVAADRLGFDPATVYRVPQGASPTAGPADAPVTIVVWSDHACGYCYRVQPTLATLEHLFPDQLRWVHRTLPLDDDQTTTAEAAYAAAAQGRFKPMSDRMYALGGRVDRAGAELVARELGLDMVRFRAELDAGVYRAQIARDAADARALGLSGTPAFFVNGRPIHGNQPVRVFVDVVEQELARARETSGGYDALVGGGKLAADTAGETRHPQVELDPTATYRVGLGLPGHQLGRDDALVTIVVFSDFQCPYCERVAPVLTKVQAAYPAHVRVVFRHLAMSYHRKAGLASEAAIAAAEQGKFWPFHDRLWAEFGVLDRADLERHATAVGLELTAFRAALDDRRYHDLVVTEAASAFALGVDGTPTMFVNGQPVSGARDLPTMRKIVEAHIDRAQAVVRAGVLATDLYALLMSDALGAERADPSRVPDAGATRIRLRGDDAVRAITAACRRRDRARAQQLIADVAPAPRLRAARVCALAGIDL